CRLLLQTFVKDCAVSPSVKISLLLNIPRSTVSGIITKWKQLGTTATQPRSGRQHKMTGVNACRSLQCAEVANCLQSQ
ncbi:unnamed protein product, partial [Staurois parvus]